MGQATPLMRVPQLHQRVLQQGQGPGLVLQIVDQQLDQTGLEFTADQLSRAPDRPAQFVLREGAHQHLVVGKCVG